MNTYLIASFICAVATMTSASELKQSLYDHATVKAMSLLVGVLPADDAELTAIAQILVKNLERSGQFTVTLKGLKEPSKKSEFEGLFEQGYPLQIFLNHEEGKKAIGWRLYDVADKKLVHGRKYTKRGSSAHGYADNLADDIWPVLTSQPSSFSSKLAYVKKKGVPGQKERHRSTICVCNSDGSQEQTMVPQLGTYVGLQWHFDKNNPCLFMSEFTRHNVRFASANFKGQKKTVLDVKGTCVGISLSAETSKAIYCRSGTIWQYSFDPVTMQATHQILIANDGNNLSPILLPTQDVIFCSDAPSLVKGTKSSGPKIYKYRASDKSITPLTHEGYCVGPSYSHVHGKVAYSKKVNGVMQLHIYDPEKKSSSQVTFDQGEKIDTSWSPCGKYLIFCYKQGRVSRIAVMHVGLKKRFYITPVHEYCTSPAWSPVFEEVPFVRVPGA